MRPHAELLLEFQRAQARFTDLVDTVEARQWDDVALPGWSVADLVAHLIGQQLAVVPLLAGRTSEVAATEDLLGDDPLTAWEDAADVALTTWADPASLTGDPAADHLARMTAELTVHAWDLARAIDADPTSDDELVAVVLRWAEQHLPDDGVPGSFAPSLEPPSGADRQVRMLARAGRRAW